MHSYQPLLPKAPGDHQPAPLIQSQGFGLGPSRRNTSRACGSCRERKTKCDGREPACSNCVSVNKTCSYNTADKRKKEPWKSMIVDLRHQNEKLEDVIAPLMCNRFPEAVERLQQLRSSNTHGGDGHSYQSITCSPSQYESISQSSQPSNPLENNQDAPSLDAIPNSLPSQVLTRRCVSAYFSCGSTLFYIVRREICEDLMSRLYQAPANMNKNEVCVLYAVAAAGSEYSNEDIPDLAKKEYFEHASSLLKDALKEDILMGMRASVALGVCLVLRKSASARTITAAGLNIVRWNMRKWMRNASVEDRLEFARVVRTLAFMECWLSSTLGYMFDLGLEEMTLLEELTSSESSENPLNSLSPSLIQSHVYRAALLSAQVQTQIQHATSLSIPELNHLVTKLDTWHEGLPDSLSLSSLVSGNIEVSPTLGRPLLFMHMVHIASRITVYERIIFMTVDQRPLLSDRSAAHQVFKLSHDIHHIYASFAQQLARIVGLLYEDNSVLSRCWLTIHSCFHASLVLLLRVAQSLVHGNHRSSIPKNLAYVRDCLLVLECCHKQDIAAVRLTDTVVPLYQRLRLMADDSATPDQTDSMSPDSNDNDDTTTSAEMGSVLCQLVSAMEIPFQDLWV